MVSIIKDTSGLVKDDVSIVITEYSEYVAAYDQIINAIKSRIDLTIVVRNSSIFDWLEKMSERYEGNNIILKKITYRSYLQERWEIQIPNNYDSDELEKLNLLELDEQPKKNDTFEDFLLTNFYDPLYSSHKLTSGMIVPLLKAIDAVSKQQNLESPLLQRIFADRIAEWKQKTQDDNLLKIIDMVFNDPESLLVDLINHKILRTDIYNEIGKVVLRDKFKIFSKLNLKDLDIDDSKISDTIKQIEINLNTLDKPETEVELQGIINKLSGILLVEYNYIENILRENPELVSTTTINLLKVVFTPIYSRIGKRIENLKQLIKPTKPEPIDSNSSFEEVKQWATEQYLPYYNWLRINNIYDEEFIQIADTFSEWLYSNWEDVRANSNSLVANWFYNNSESFKDSEKINLTIIIDNLSWSHSDYLKSLFVEKGLAEINRTPYISMIPSETESSKKCLLSGKLDYKEIDEKSYNNILQKGWVPFFNSSEFIYIKDLESLESIKVVKGKSYFVNYHSIDSALHREQSILGTTHEKQIKNLLNELSERVYDYLNNNGVIDKTILHIISDHGSTKLHKDRKNDIDAKYFKKLNPIKISERYIILSDEQFNAMPDNLKHDCFFIDKHRFGLLSNVLCARRGNTFKDSTGISFLHGSLLPEEMIVPHLVFEKVEIKLDDLIINLVKDKYRYKAEEIELNVLNPNNAPIEGIHLQIMNGNIESNPQLIEWIAPKSSGNIKIQSRFKKTNNQEDENYLTIKIRYIVNNKPFEYTKREKITMISTVQLKDTSVFDI